jgi:hypothetical protein
MRFRGETAANVVTASCVLAIVVTLSYRYNLLSDAPPPQIATAVTISRALGVDFAKATHTLILVIQQDCIYCTNSMPFYRRLIQERTLRQAQSLQIVIAAPWRDRDTDIDSYLASEKIQPDAVIFPSAADIPVRMTPTLLLADSTGAIIKAWPGFLSSAVEQEVRGAIFDSD